MHNIFSHIKKNWQHAICFATFVVIINAAHAQFQDSVTIADTVVKQQNFETSTKESKQLISTRSVDEAQLEKLRKDEAFWYVNTSPVHEVAKQPAESFLNKLVRQHWFRNLMWLLMIGGFVAVLVWFLVSSNIKLLRKKTISLNKSENDGVAENIFDINYAEEIYKAINAENYRLATRLMYLQLLKDLSQKGIMQYKQERTNNDYVMQLYNTPYYKPFFHLTRNFEYAWYGQFQVKPEVFKTIRLDFESFKKTLP